MTSPPCNIKAIKKGLYDGPPEYILIENPYQLISELCFCLINSVAISFQYCSSVSLFHHIIL